MNVDAPAPPTVSPDTQRRTAVVLLHGLCGTPEELLSVAAPLRQLGCTVVPLVIPGYSFLAKAPNAGARSLEDWVGDVQACVQELHRTHGKVVLTGISAGSGLALASAMDPAVQVDGIVLMSTILRYDGWAIPAWHFLLPLALYTPLGQFWCYREQPPFGVKNERVRSWIARELKYRRTSRAGSATIGISFLRQHDRLMRHVRRHLSDVQCPQVLAIHAEEDEMATLKNLEMLRRGLAPANTRLRTVVVTNSYHMISIDNDREIVTKEVLDFVRSITHAA